MSRRTILVRALALTSAVGISFVLLPGRAGAADHNFRKRITIDSTRVSGTSDLVDFPVLIHLVDPDLRTVADGGGVESASGLDITFRASDGVTKLDFEIEKYTSDLSSGTLIAWVKVPAVSPTTDTDFYIYYGNPGISCPQENPAAVWTSSFKGVWHLTEDPTGPAPQFIDSTSNTNDGTASTPNGPSQTAGAINGSLSFVDDNTERHVSIPHHSSLQFSGTDLTVSAWIKTTQPPNADVAVILAKWSSSNRDYWFGKLAGDGWAFFVDDSQSTQSSFDGVLNDGAWHHVAGVADAANSQLRLYVDGVPINTTFYNGIAATGTTDLHFGNSTDTVNQEWKDGIDEVRIAGTARTTDWLLTEFNNQSSPSTFYSVGTQEVGPWPVPWRYGYRKKITIDSSQVCGSSNLLDFPVLVSLTDPDLRTKLDGGRLEHPSGYDIDFRAADGVTHLDYQVEKYASDLANGTLIAWVTVPSLSPTVNTDVYLYYGNREVACSDETSDVWTTAYRGVWHLDEDPTDAAPQFLDSTSNANDGTANVLGSANQVPGQIDGSLSFDDSNARHVNVPHDPSLQITTDITVSAWVKTTDVGADAGVVVAKWGTGGHANYWLGKFNSTDFRFIVDGAQGVTIPFNNVKDGTWRYVVGVAEAGTSSVRLYLDGAQQGTAAYTGTTQTGTAALHIGDSPDITGQEWNGGIDEVRVAATARSTCWIQTEYNNQSSPSTFYTVGTEEADPPTAVRMISFTATGSDGAVLLDWQTGSEIDNLGFHLYRAFSREGPYQRITDSAIPGLGSSPEGAAYRYFDSGLTNGAEYFYQVEDIETTGATTRHGPVSAVPSDDAALPSDVDESTSSRIIYGDPSQTSFRALEEGRGHWILELRAGGFVAARQEDGSVRLEIPGFVALDEPGLPNLPVKRTWVDVLPGRKVKLAAVKVTDVESFTGLRPSSAEPGDVIGSKEGAVRVVRARGARTSPALGLVPEEAARLLSVGLQREIKKALVELAPLRWDGGTGELLFARRLEVRLVLAEPEPLERVLGPARARRHAESESHRSDAPVARLVVAERGLQRVRFEELFGRTGRAMDVGDLRLRRLGEPVAFHVETDNGVFGPGSSLYFVSEGPDLNPYGREAVYEIDSSSAGGLLMELASVSPWGDSARVYWRTEEREENRFYQATLIHASDLWFWDVLFAPVRKSYSFPVSALAESLESSRLELRLQGASDFPSSPDHHIRVYVNGSFVGEVSIDGKTATAMDAAIPPGLLHEGENWLELENVGDTEAPYSMVFLDRFALTYPRLLLAESEGVEGIWMESGAAEIVSSEAYAVDVTDVVPRWLSGEKVAPAAGLRFRVEAGRKYLLVSRGALRNPEIRKPLPSSLKDPQNRADSLVIGPQEFLNEADALLEHRRREGLRIQAISIEEIYSGFGFGEARPEAIREFLSYAFHHWRAAPRYVLLLGDGSYDYKDNLGTGVRNRVPPLLTQTSYLWTASDPSLVSVNGSDPLPDLAIGRLPAATVEEVRTMVEKILVYESSGPTWGGPVVLVTDNPDEGGDFVSNAEDIAVNLLEADAVRKIYLAPLGTEATRNAIVQAFDEGATLMSYIGHGGIHVWADENVFDIGRVELLSPQSRQPLLLTMNCLNGYFHFPYFDSLSEALLKADGRGAIAAFSPSGLSLNGPAHLYHKALIGELVGGSHERLGDAILAAQEEYARTGAMPELLKIYHLLGDPALRLR